MIRLYKPVIIILIFVCALFFFSCTPQTEPRSFSSENTEDMYTLKKETELRRRTLVWTEQMKKGGNEGSSEDNEESAAQDDLMTVVPFFSEKLRILTADKEKSIYPELPVLGRMDLSQMSPSIYSKLTDFLNGLKNKNVKSSDAVFAEKFIGVIFLYELDFYPDVFSWYVGSPFISGSSGAGVEDVYEIPVLIMTKSGKFMCWISIDASKAFQSEFLIKQIVLGDLM